MRRAVQCSVAVAGALATTAARIAAQDIDTSLLRVRVESAPGLPDRIPAAGRAAIVSITARDPATGFAMDGLRPALWIVPDDANGCESWYRRITGSPILPDGVVPLVGYDLIQATPDGHVAVIDPLLNLASANIRAIHPVSGKIRDWGIARDGRSIALVSGIDVGGADGSLFLIVLDGAGKATRIATTAPAHTILVNGSAYWVGLRDGTAVFLDPSGTVGTPVAIGTGPVRLIALKDDKAIALAADGHGRSIDGALTGEALSMGQPVANAAYASLADAVFALTTDGQTLLHMPIDAPGAVTATMLPTRYSGINADTKGRMNALLARDGKRLSRFDTSVMRLRWTIDIPDPVIDLAFSDNFLYLMHTRQGGVTRVIFDAEGGPPGLAAIAAGLPSDVPQSGGALSHMVRIPGAGIMVASSRERVAYMISEDGAQAAMSSLPLRAGLTEGIALRLRSLTPTGRKGEYAARFAPRYGGKYLAVAQIDSPSLLHCASFSVSGPADPALKAAGSDTIQAIKLGAALEGDALRVMIAGMAADIAPRRAILVAQEGNWRRLFGAPRRLASGDYAYPADQIPPGSYRLFLELADAGTVETDLVLPSLPNTAKGRQ